MNIFCRVCGSLNKHTIDDFPLALKNSDTEYHGAHCSNCLSISYLPYPTTEALIAHYSNEYNFYQGGNHKQIARGIGFSKLYLKPHAHEGRVLDVGCASADFLYGISRSSNWDCWGIDINEESTKRAKERTGLNIIFGDIFSKKLPVKYFDALHLRDVIEHVPDPISFLKRARSLLKDDGIIYVRIPNGINEYSSKRKTHKQTDRPVISTPGHIFYISPKGFNALCSVTGLKINRRFSDGFKNGLRNLGLWPIPKFRRISKRPIKVPNSVQELPDIKSLEVAKSLKKYLSEETRLKKGSSKFALEHVYILSPKI